MQILIMGVGGLGGVFATELIRNGITPTLLTHNGVITQAINMHGLTLHTPHESDVKVRARAITTVNEIKPGTQFDAVWLVTKANSVLEAARGALPFLAPDGYMVAFQNGLVEEVIIDVLGSPSRLLTASVAFGGTLIEPGVYRRTTDGTVFVGELDGTVTERVETLAAQLSHVITTKVSTNILGLLWGKLCWNAAVSGLGAVAGYTYGEIAATRRGRNLLIACYTEVINTAWAHNIEVVPEVVGPTVALHLPTDADQATRDQRHQILINMTQTFAAVEPSSLQSLKRGRPTETEFLNGYIVKKAAEKGITVPLNTRLVKMITEIELGDRDITPANLNDLETS
jgi:2-dehydropantoate 2-reductase